MDNKKVKMRSKKKSKKKMKKKPIDDEALQLAAENAKRELIEFLSVKTEIPEEELLVHYEEFHESYPSGEITKKEFLAQSKVLKDTETCIIKYKYYFSGRNVSC